jgi:hypothetical protein
MIRDELNAAGEAVRALARQRQAAGYLARLQATKGTDQMPLPPSLEADLIALAGRCHAAGVAADGRGPRGPAGRRAGNPRRACRIGCRTGPRVFVPSVTRGPPYVAHCVTLHRDNTRG